MRIVLQSTVFLPTPAKGAGAVEYLCGKLAELLTARGHVVTLACLEGSTAKVATRMTCSPAGSAAAREGALTKAIVELKDVDVLFDHSLHQLAQRRKPGLPAVSMSHGVALLSPWARNWVFTSKHHGRLHGFKKPPALWNGVDVSEIPFHEKLPAEDSLLWVGRIMPYKRLHLAIEIARHSDVPLVIAGPITDGAYYKEVIQPLLTDGITYLGEVSHETIVGNLMRDSSALLFTSDETEPAGIVLLEAQAAGRSVLAFDHGANREFLQDGETGALGKNIDQLVMGVKDGVWEHFDPATCRAWVEEHRSLEAMATLAEGYLELAAKGDIW